VVVPTSFLAAGALGIYANESPAKVSICRPPPPTTDSSSVAFMNHDDDGHVNDEAGKEGERIF